MVDRKRAWFQIHLSTAIALMFSASALLWLNIQPRRGYDHPSFFTQGWPFPFLFPYAIQENLSYSIGPFEWAVFLIDSFIAFLLLSAVGFFIEARTRGKSFFSILVWLIFAAAIAIPFVFMLMMLLQRFVGHRHPK